MKNDEVDVAALERLVEFHIESGTHGLVPCGTTGESATLTEAEHELVIGTVVEKAAGRIPVLAGAGSNSTHEAVAYTKFAEKVGADGVLHITPYYNKPTQEGLYQHFAAIAEASSLPIVLYNVPGRTAIDMVPDTVARLAEIPTVIGIKEATGSVDRSVEILRACDLEILSGDDSLTLALMAVGARGVISVAANIVPKLIVDLVGYCSSGDTDAARDLHLRLYPLFSKLFLETNPIPVKAAVATMGRCGPGIRLPMTPATEETNSVLARLLRELEVNV